MKRWVWVGISMKGLLAVAAVALAACGIAYAGGNGVGSGGLNGFPAAPSVSGSQISPSSVNTNFIDAGIVKTTVLHIGAVGEGLDVTSGVAGYANAIGRFDIRGAAVSGLHASIGPAGTGYFRVNSTGTTQSDVSSGSRGFELMNEGARLGIGPDTYLVETGAAVVVTANDGLTVTPDTTTPARAGFRLTPQDAEPTGPNVVGDMYVTTAGILKICTVAGSPGTWVSVGAQ